MNANRNLVAEAAYGTGELYPGEFESRHYKFEEETDEKFG